LVAERVEEGRRGLGNTSQGPFRSARVSDKWSKDVINNSEIWRRTKNSGGGEAGSVGKRKFQVRDNQPTKKGKRIESD